MHVYSCVCTWSNTKYNNSTLLQYENVKKYFSQFPHLEQRDRVTKEGRPCRMREGEGIHHGVCLHFFSFDGRLNFKILATTSDIAAQSTSLSSTTHLVSVETPLPVGPSPL